MYFRRNRFYSDFFFKLIFSERAHTTFVVDELWHTVDDIKLIEFNKYQNQDSEYVRNICEQAAAAMRPSSTVARHRNYVVRWSSAVTLFARAKAYLKWMDRS